MELLPPGAPLRDPLLETVRSRHPDVDVVALPPEPPPVPTAVVDDQEVAATFELVRRLATALWAQVGDASAAPPVDPDFGPLCGTVVIRSRHCVTVPGRPHLLAELGDHLQGEGWHFRRPWGAVERLVGELDGVELRGIYAAGSGMLLVTLTSAAMYVGQDRARSLVRR